MNVRINKFLAAAGLGSRRDVEALIENGRVSINGDKAILTDNVIEGDTVCLDGEELPVDDLLRELEAEEKERIAYQISDLRYADDDFDMNGYGGGNTPRSRNSRTAKRPTKFKKNADDFDSAFSPNRNYGHKKKSTTTRGRTIRTSNEYSNEGYQDFSEEVRENSQLNSRYKTNAPTSKDRNSAPNFRSHANRNFSDRSSHHGRREDEHRHTAKRNGKPFAKSSFRRASKNGSHRD